MGEYQKNIIYLYLYRNETRLSCAGFVKMERLEKHYGIYVGIKGAGQNVTGEFDLFLKEDEGTIGLCIGRILLEKGYGEFHISWNGNQIQDVDRLWESFHIFEIPLQSDGVVRGFNKHVVKRKKDNVGKIEQDTLKEIDSYDQDTINDGTESNVYSSEDDVHRKEKDAYSLEVAGFNAEDNQEVNRLGARNKQIVEYQADKWDELKRTHETLYPFGKERCYILLTPGDIPLLTSSYQQLACNSFLLHGFYNYKQLILGKEDEIYYLGVPGTYHEREKMVALMFGFESFESKEEKPITGTFGYYMRKVEI